MKNLIKSVWALLLACIVSMGMTSCADAEDGESWGDWEFRNAINCGKLTEWSLNKVKEANGEWGDPYRADVPLFRVQFFASDHNFHSTKGSWIWVKDNEGNGEWRADEAAMEEYKPADNTAFTVDSKTLTIEATVDGAKYFRIVLDKQPTSVMEGKLHFYKENKTYEVQLIR